MTISKAWKTFITGTRWFTPAEITPEIIYLANQKLIGVTGVHGDALSDVTIEFTTKVSGSTRSLTKRYNMPIALYLLTGDEDITDALKDFFLKRFESLSEEDAYRVLCLRYAIRSIGHLSGKNLAHALLGDAKLIERPNKRALIETLLEFECIRDSYFTQFEEVEEWNGPHTGAPCSNEFKSIQYGMDSAVQSGAPFNVEMAVRFGLKPRYERSSYGASTFAYVSNYAWKKEYGAIARILIMQAIANKKLERLLSGGQGKIPTVVNLCKAGLVDLIALYDLPIASYLKGGVFRNLRGDGRGWTSGIYDSAVVFLQIEPPADDDPTLELFCSALRSAALAEIEEDSNFLLTEVSFTESFRKKALNAIAAILPMVVPDT